MQKMYSVGWRRMSIDLSQNKTPFVEIHAISASSNADARTWQLLLDEVQTYAISHAFLLLKQVLYALICNFVANYWGLKLIQR